jgi:cell wall-associated NlpC family hydrolase
MTDLEIAERIAWHYIGTPYKWGGDDFSGFDCSGFVCEILQSIGKIGRKEDYNAQSLFKKFKDMKVNQGELGVLVFFGLDENHIYHIEFCLNEKLAVGASGGGAGCVTIEDAIMQSAFIKIRPIFSRNDVVAFVNPFKET